MTEPILKTKRHRTSLPCPACGKPISFWRILLWLPSHQKSCPACKATLRLKTRKSMPSRKKRLIYLLIAVMVISYMTVLCLSSGEFWILMPDILFIIVLMFVLYRSAGVRYLEELENPKPLFPKVNDETQQISNMTGLTKKTKRLQKNTTSPCPVCGKPISVMPYSFNLIRLWEHLPITCPACNVKLRPAIRGKEFLLDLLIISPTLVICLILIPVLGQSLDWVVGLVGALIFWSTYLYVVLCRSGRTYYFKDLGETKNPPSRNQQS